MEMQFVCTMDTSPGRVCKEAADSILELVRHHESLSDGAQVAGFLQSFKNASIGFLDVYGQESRTRLSRNRQFL